MAKDLAGFVGVPFSRFSTICFQIRCEKCWLDFCQAGSFEIELGAAEIQRDGEQGELKGE